MVNSQDFLKSMGKEVPSGGFKKKKKKGDHSAAAKRRLAQMDKTKEKGSAGN